MRVAVTGGTGCLGQPLVEKLLSRGLAIQLLALPDDPALSALAGRVEVVIGSLDSRQALDQVTAGCEVVFHLAGKVHSTPKTAEEEQSFFRVNADGTRSLLEASHRNRVRRVVLYSTVGVYGRDADFEGAEESACRPVTAYARSKYLAERLVLDSAGNGGPEGVVLRFPVVYGPLDRGNVAALIEAVRCRYFFYFGDGSSHRSMISSVNAAEAALAAALKPQCAGGTFCVTDGRDYALRELVEAICLSLGTHWRPRAVPLTVGKALGRAGDLLEGLLPVTAPINTAKVLKLSRPLVFSCRKALDVLGYRPVEDLRRGIHKEVQWLKQNRGWD